MNTHYINTDLDLTSNQPIDELIKIFATNCCLLDYNHDKEYYARIESVLEG